MSLKEVEMEKVSDYGSLWEGFLNLPTLQKVEKKYYTTIIQLPWVTAYNVLSLPFSRVSPLWFTQAYNP